MTDTETTLETRHPRPALVVAALMMLASLPSPTAAEPSPLDARVVWVRGTYAYVAARDSLALPPFSLLTFMMKSKTIATGEVERLVDGGMAVARITSGSLKGVKKLDRLRIIAEAPRGPRLHRVGYPSPKRAHLLFACDSMAIGSDHGYLLQGAGPHYRLIGSFDLEYGHLSALHHRLLDSSDYDYGGMSALPDTILVRTFDDAADEEIALERGDLDVAVFWPGELSTHMREHPRWKNRRSWPLGRGLIATIPETGSTETHCAIARRAAGSLRALGQGLFRGDLLVSREAPSCGDTIPSDLAAVRYRVDPSCPGYVTLERFLNRDAPRGPNAPVAPVLPLSWQDPRTFSSDEVVTATALCQVVFASESFSREFLAGFYVTLFDCIPPERKP